jgi:hypothetical protein
MGHFSPLALLLTLFAIPAGAQSNAPEASRTSIDCRNVPLRTALRTLVQNAGLRHNVRYETPDIRVSLQLRDVPFEDALAALLRQASFSGTQYRLFRTPEGYTVRSGSKLFQNEREDWPALLTPAEPTAAFLRKEQAVANSVVLRDALRQVFTAAGAVYVMDENLPNVTLTVPPAPSATLWGNLLRIMGEARRSIPGLYVGQIGEIYVIAMRPHLPVKIESPSLQDGPYGSQRKISIRLVETPLRAAIDAVFAGTGHQYAVNPDVPDVPINVEIRDLPFQTALRLILRIAARQVPGLTVSKG